MNISFINYEFDLPPNRMKGEMGVAKVLVKYSSHQTSQEKLQ